MRTGLFKIVNPWNSDNKRYICGWIYKATSKKSNYIFSFSWKFNEEIVQEKIYFIIDQQIAQHFVQYSECLWNPPLLVCN